jgi:hypothetical protein
MAAQASALASMKPTIVALRRQPCRSRHQSAKAHRPSPRKLYAAACPNAARIRAVSDRLELEDKLVPALNPVFLGAKLVGKAGCTMPPQKRVRMLEVLE